MSFNQNANPDYKQETTLQSNNSEVDITIGQNEVDKENDLIDKLNLTIKFGEEQEEQQESQTEKSLHVKSKEDEEEDKNESEKPDEQSSKQAE